MYKGFRHPRTSQERRLVAALRVEDIIVPIRAARMGRCLPNEYDDLDRSKPERSWKSYRHTQYKIVVA